MNAIESKLEQTDKAFISYMMGNATLAADYATLVEQGTSIVEIGVPFTDPVADGAVIQAAGLKALRAGITLTSIFETIAKIPVKTAPIVLMTYLNPIFAMGYKTFAKTCRKTGVSGVIVPDLPFEENATLKKYLDAENIILITLITATTTAERMQRIMQEARGFIYAVTVKGVTGERQAFSDEVFTFLEKVKKSTKVPVMAGFGISTATQVTEMLPHCDGVIVGSRIVHLLEEKQAEQIGELIAATRV